MYDTAIPPLTKGSGRRPIGWEGRFWLGFLVLAIFFFDGLFLWGVLDFSQSYQGELTIMRGHEICEIHMVQFAFNAMLWLGGLAAVLLGMTILVMWKAFRAWQRRLLILLSTTAIALVIFAGSNDWLTSSFDENIHEQGHRLDFDMQSLHVKD